ncbi:hypothetical protein [Lysobacter xanthus]
MSSMPARLAALALVLLLGACSEEKRSGEPRQPADEPEAAERSTGVTGAEGFQGRGTAVAPADVAAAPNPRAAASFTCDGGHRVEIGDLVAVVTLKDGRRVQIARDPDDAFRFRGEALAFRMTDGKGELSQDEGGTFACTAG